jgi:hypothetical protein
MRRDQIITLLCCLGVLSPCIGRHSLQSRQRTGCRHAEAGVPDEPLGNFTAYRVNIPRPADMQRRYDVPFPPAVVLLDAQGREVYRRECGVDQETLIEQMMALLAERPEGGS